MNLPNPPFLSVLSPKNPTVIPSWLCEVLVKSLAHLVTHFSMKTDLARPTTDLADSEESF